MSTARTMELALRVATDLKQAGREVDALTGSVGKLGTTAQKTGDALGKVDTSKLEQLGAAGDRAAAGVERAGAAADGSSERYRRIAADAIAYREALDAQVLASQATTAADRDAASASADLATQWSRLRQVDPYASAPSQMRALDDLNQRLVAGAVSTQQLADTEQRLDRARAAGLVTEEEYADAIAALDKQEKQLLATQAKEEAQARSLLRAYDPVGTSLAKLASDEVKLKAAVDAGRISRDQYNRAMTGVQSARADFERMSQGVDKSTSAMGKLNVQSMGVQRNLSQLVTYGASGNFRLAGAQLLQLGNQAGIAGGLFSGAGLAVGGVVGVLGLFIAAAIKGSAATEQLQRSVQVTGNILGTTSGELADVVDRVGEATGSYDDAATAVNGLAKSGKLSADALEAGALAAVNLAKVTGDSVEETTKKIVQLAEKPSEELAKLNAQYHGITLEVYEHVKSLEEQGRAQDAARVAVEAFGQVHEKRVQEAIARAGSLERAWAAARDRIRDAWQFLKDVGRDDLEAQIATAQRGVRLMNEQIASIEQDYLSGLRSESDANRQLAFSRKQREEQQRNLDLLLKQKAGVDAKNKAEADEQAIQDEAIAARAKIDKQIEDGLDNKAKRQKALNDLIREYNIISIANPNDPRLYDGSYDRLKKAIEDKFKAPKVPATDSQKADAAAAKEIADLKQKLKLIGDLDEGQKKNTETERIRAAIADGSFKNASRENKQALLDAAAAVDIEQQRVEIAKQLVTVKLQTMTLQGKGDEGKLEETLKTLDRLKAKLEGLGRSADAADVAKLMNLEKAKVQLTSLQQALDAFFARSSAAEKKVDIDRESGLISSIEAQRRLLELRQQEIAYLQQQIPLLEAQNAILGDPRVTEQLEQMKLKLYELQQQGTLLETTFRNSFESELGDALEGLANRTLSLKEAVSGLIGGLAQDMLKFEAQQLASLATARLMKALKGGDGADATGAASTAAAAGALLGAGSAVAAGGAAVTGGAAALAASAAALQAAASTLIIANSIGSASGFAEGGWTGHGGKYQIAGYVHRGEGVLSQEDIAAIGGEQGFYALRHAIRSGISLPQISAPSMAPSPRYSFADGGMATGALPVSVLNQMRLYLYHDIDELAAAVLSHPATEQKILATVGENPGGIQASWQGGG